MKKGPAKETKRLVEEGLSQVLKNLTISKPSSKTESVLKKVSISWSGLIKVLKC